VRGVMTAMLLGIEGGELTAGPRLAVVQISGLMFELSCERRYGTWPARRTIKEEGAQIEKA